MKATFFFFFFHFFRYLLSFIPPPPIFICNTTFNMAPKEIIGPQGEGTTELATSLSNQDFAFRFLKDSIATEGLKFRLSFFFSHSHFSFFLLSRSEFPHVLQQWPLLLCEHYAGEHGDQEVLVLLYFLSLFDLLINH